MATTHVDASRPRTRPMATQKKSTKTTTSQVSAINGNSSIKVARSDSSKDVSTLAQVMGILAMMASVVMPTLASWGMTTGLIFGGCCSNVGLLGYPSFSSLNSYSTIIPNIR